MYTPIPAKSSIVPGLEAANQVTQASLRLSKHVPLGNAAPSSYPIPKKLLSLPHLPIPNALPVGQPPKADGTAGMRLANAVNRTALAFNTQVSADAAVREGNLDLAEAILSKDFSNTERQHLEADNQAQVVQKLAKLDLAQAQKKNRQDLDPVPRFGAHRDVAPLDDSAPYDGPRPVGGVGVMGDPWRNVEAQGIRPPSPLQYDQSLPDYEEDDEHFPVYGGDDDDYGMSDIRIGDGLKGTSRKKKATGFTPFGKLEIDKVKLGNNILSIRYGSSKHKVPEIGNCQISPSMQAAVVALLSNMEPNKDNLSVNERAVLDKISHLAASSNSRKGRGIKTPVAQVSNARMSALLKNRIKVIAGEIQAGNSSNAMKHQLSSVIRTGLEFGAISEKEASLLTRHFIARV